jgi:hypothetical protein
MGMMDEDDTVYCNLQMPLAKGTELLELITKLREAGDHPTLDAVFQQMQDELIDSVEAIAEDDLGASWKKWQDSLERQYSELLKGEGKLLGVEVGYGALVCRRLFRRAPIRFRTCDKVSYFSSHRSQRDGPCRLIGAKMVYEFYNAILAELKFNRPLAVFKTISYPAQFTSGSPTSSFRKRLIISGEPASSPC